MAATSKAWKILLSLTLLATSSGALPGNEVHQARAPDYTSVCKQIASSISNASDVNFPLLQGISYSSDIYHWASSSSQSSACSVRPGTAEDVGTILKIVGSTKTPFAVKGGGHTANPGFSSTEGVHISMTKFSDVVYDANSGTAEVGAGLVWDDVYDALDQYNVNVVGGRVPGVGVAGFTLGGGYSFKTNQYGLTIDTVKVFELVLPNGTVTTVTSSSDPELFFGLKGGFNNFGIVTKFTLETHPQTKVWGGLITYTGDKFNAISAATANFSVNCTDPKAAIIAEFNVLLGLPGITLNLFYDAPEAPDGIFDSFLSVGHVSKDVSSRSFVDLIAATPSQLTSGMRGIFNAVTVENFTPELMKVILNETTARGDNIKTLFASTTFISYDVEPFVDSLFTHGSNSAYPPSRDRGLRPLNLYYAWELPSADDYFFDLIKDSAATIKAAAIAQGQDVENVSVYGNYAVHGTSLDQIYGDNLSRLQTLKATVDPESVMDLSGGWKFTSA